MSSNDRINPNNRSCASRAKSYICRICLLCTNYNMEKISLVAEKFEFVTNLAVQDGDGFPIHICRQCLFDLVIAHGFIKRSITSNSFLQSGPSEPSQDISTTGDEPAEEIPALPMENCSQVQAELCQADAEPIIQVMAEPHGTSIDRKPETNPLQLYSEQRQLETDCNVGPTFKYPTDPLQTPVAAIYHSENIQQNTVGPVSCASEFLPAIKVESPSVTDSLLSSNNDDDDGFANDSPCAGSQDDLNDDFEGYDHVGVSGFQKMSSKRGMGRNIGKHKQVKISHAFKCNRCDASFSVKLFLYLHLRSHSPLDKGKTEYAERFRNKVGKLEAKSFPSPICGMPFIRKKNMTNHVQTDHQPVDMTSCNTQAQANQDIADSSTLTITVMDQAHANLEVKERSKLTRDRCGSSFRKRMQMLRHSKVHKLYKCTACQKEFLDKASLVSHLNYHERKPSFTCYKCKKQFSDNFGLVAHKMITKHMKGISFDWPHM